MDLIECKALCGSYGDHCNRKDSGALGFPRQNSIHRLSTTAKPRPTSSGKAIHKFKTWAGKTRNIYYEPWVKNQTQKREFVQPIYDDYLPDRYILLTDILNYLRETNPDYFDVFSKHYCWYFYQGKRLNLKDKYRLTGFKKDAYYARLNHVHNLVMQAYTDLERKPA